MVDQREICLMRRPRLAPISETKTAAYWWCIFLLVSKLLFSKLKKICTQPSQYLETHGWTFSFFLENVL